MDSQHSEENTLPPSEDNFDEIQQDSTIGQDHYGTHAIDFLRYHLAHPANSLRVATGYFTLQGYNLLRPYLQCNEVRILVGFDQNAPIILHNELVKDVMFHLRKWNSAERREAVQQIVASIRAGNFQIVKKDSIEMLGIRSRQKHHEKVYILDEYLVLEGSVNLTVGGLVHNSENCSMTTEHSRVIYFLKGYEQNWNAPDAYDVTQELLAALLRWLDLALPYDVYLKTIDAISPRKKSSPPRSSYKMPNTYQDEVVKRMIRQIEQYRGCILIASTGLGKTIIATHTALELANLGLVKSVIVFAPVATHKDWHEALDSARLNYKVFTRNLLDSSPKENSHKVFEVLRHLEEADQYTYIIIDEAQYFANENRKPRKTGKGFIVGERVSFKRVREAIQTRNAIITLMTATPFVKRPADVNNQLKLLPYTGSPIERNKKGQLLLPFEPTQESRVWQVSENESFFEEFATLPISTIITTSYVIKHYCRDDGGLDFPDGTRFLPHTISQFRTTIPIFLEADMSKIYERGYLEHSDFQFMDRDFTRKRTRWTIQKQATVAWMSSPLALRRVIEKTVDGSWDKTIPFRYSLESRRSSLEPLILKLKKMYWKTDVKFLTLLRILDDAISQNKKVILFVEVLPTAIYLQQQLKRARPNFNVACSVAYDRQTNRYRSKSLREVHQLIWDFAPEANANIRNPRFSSKHYDIFITTDAYGVGVNLQDASVVVNYDLSWTPDVIIQRAGRILRWWKEPRVVAVHTFTHSFSVPETTEASRRVLKRTEDLYRRAKHATLFTELPLLAEQDELEHSILSELSRVRIEDIGVLSPDNIEHVKTVSPMLDRLAERRLHLERTKNISDDILSALETYKTNKVYLYLLLKVETRNHLVMYDTHSKRLLNMSEDEILNLIHCSPDTSPAPIDPLEIEFHAAECIKLWCEQKHIELEMTERICTLYIIPKSQSASFPLKKVGKE
jgi:superfamily II DNA or RNA helicase